MSIIIFKVSYTSPFCSIELIMLDIFIVAVFLSISFAIGIYKGRNIVVFQDYAIGSRNYSNPVLVSTIFATFLGAGATLGVTEKIYGFGSVVYIFLLLSHPLSKLIISELIAPRMSRFYDLLSAGDIIERFYGKYAKIIAGASGCLLLVGLFGTQTYFLHIFFHHFTGLPSSIITFILVSIFVTYTIFGGIRSVTSTGIFYFCLIVFAIPIIGNAAITNVGGFDKVIAHITQKHITFFPEGKNKLRYIFFFSMFCIPFLNPAVIQRLLMAKDARQLINSIRVSAILDVPFYITITTIGLCMFILDSSFTPQFALPHFVNHYLPSGIKGLAIVGILAVIMSAADSYLNTASISFVHDFLNPLLGNTLKDKQKIHLSRWVTLLVGIVVIIAVTNSLLPAVERFSDFSIAWIALIVVPLYAAILNFNVQKVDFFAGICGSIIVFIFWSLRFPTFDPTFPSAIANLAVFSSSLMLRKLVKSKLFLAYAKNER